MVDSTGGTPARAFVDEGGGRLKAYRPLPEADRAAAVARGLEAYARGEFYRAHEEMEPAWMGSADPGERALLRGLIKVAAGMVHAVRGNPAGVRTNLSGARERLAIAAKLGGRAPGGQPAIDTARLIADLDAIVARLPGLQAGSSDAQETGRATLAHDVAGPPSSRHRRPLAIDPPILAARTGG